VAHSFSRENQSERRNGGAGTLQFHIIFKAEVHYFTIIRHTISRSRSSGGGDTDRDFNALQVVRCTSCYRYNL